METTQKVSFERKGDGMLVRKVDTSAPVILELNEIGRDKTHSEQILTKEGEEEYRKFGEKLEKDLEEKIKLHEKELKDMKHLGHEELTKDHMDAFVKAVQNLKKDPTGGKVKIENIDKLCGLVFRRINAKFQLADAKKKLVAIKQEMEELRKVQ
jgi:hypothetical protein